MSDLYFVCAGCGGMLMRGLTVVSDGPPRPSRCTYCGKDRTWLDGFAGLDEAEARREEVLRSIHGGSVRA